MTSPPAPRAHSSTSAQLHVSVFNLTHCLFSPPSVGVPEVADTSLLMEEKGKLILAIEPLDVTAHSLTEGLCRRRLGAQGTHPRC